jgi:GWxTD domain-containing protein
MPYKIYGYIVLILFLTAGYLFPQVDEPKVNQPSDQKHFFVDPLFFYVKDSTKARMDVYLQMPYTKLQPKKNQNTNNFDFNIDYTIDLHDSNDISAVYKSYTETISITEEQQKNMEDMSAYRIKQFYVKPGRYTLYTTLRDKNLSTEYKNETKVTVPDYSAGIVNISSIMFLSDYKVDDKGKKNITPVISNNLGDVQKIFMFFEIYNNSENTVPVSVSYKISDEKSTVMKDGSFSYMLQPGTNQKIERIPELDLYSGVYKFELYSSAYPESYAFKNIEFRWSDIPFSLKDLNLAIDQMVYIATNDEIAFIKKASSQAEKERRFWKFWKDKDPTPSKKGNKTMNEYYRRINIATMRYSNYNKPGWKSDMGMVFVIYGEPSEIDRHPFEADTRPYENWIYYDLNQYFTFVDYTGFGDYTLITPIYDKRFRL